MYKLHKSRTHKGWSHQNHSLGYDHQAREVIYMLPTHKESLEGRVTRSCPTHNCILYCQTTLCHYLYTLIAFAQVHMNRWPWYHRGSWIHYTWPHSSHLCLHCMVAQVGQSKTAQKGDSIFPTQCWQMSHCHDIPGRMLADYSLSQRNSRPCRCSSPEIHEKV